MADISRVKIGSSYYDIKDTVARNAVAGGVQFIMAYDGGTPVAAKIPEGVEVDGVTGALAAADAQAGAFYLVKEQSPTSTGDAYAEYVPIQKGSAKIWEKIGNVNVDLDAFRESLHLGTFAEYNSFNLTYNTDKVLGENTTFSNSTSTVTFTGGSTDVVLGENTTFTASKPTITANNTTKYIKATATGTALNTTNNSFITGLGTAKTKAALTAVSPTTQKLVTTSITPTNGTESVSAVTKTASKLVTTSVPNVTDVGTASTWSFSVGSGTDAETLIITGANSTAPTLGTAITAATGAVSSTGTGSDVVTNVTISNKTVAKAGTAVTVATGSITANGTGGSVVTEVGSESGTDFIYELGTPTTANALTSASVSTQPTITLAAENSSGTGKVGVITAAAPELSAAPTITVGTNDKVTAVTNIGTGTAAAQTITVGTNDKVDALINAQLEFSKSATPGGR